MQVSSFESMAMVSWRPVGTLATTLADFKTTEIARHEDRNVNLPEDLISMKMSTLETLGLFRGTQKLRSGDLEWGIVFGLQFFSWNNFSDLQVDYSVS